MSDHLPINHLEELLLLYSEESNWDYEQLSNNASITEHVIDVCRHKNWNYEKLVGNPAIGFKFIVNHPFKSWYYAAFAYNPSLDANTIDKMMNEMKQNNETDKLVQFLHCPQFVESMHNFVREHHYEHLQTNRFVRDEIRSILKQYEQSQSIDNNMLQTIRSTAVLTNEYLGLPLLYGMVMLARHLWFDVHRDVDNFQTDERFVDLFSNEDRKCFCNCMSLEYVATTDQELWEDIIDNCTELTNPSIIQSIYNLYRNQKNPEEHAKIGKHNIQDILSISPCNEIYYEDSVIFTHDQFLEFSLKTSLLNFTNNPNFEWETVADWTWNEYDFISTLSCNEFQQHVQYHKSKILHELEEIGIFLQWNALEDLYYDDFDAMRFLAKLEKEIEDDPTSSTDSTKRIKSL